MIWYFFLIFLYRQFMARKMIRRSNMFIKVSQLKLIAPIN